MSKELEALERIRELKREYASKMPSIEEDLSIIEAALKSYEVLVEIHSNMINSIKPIENKLKALEIIIEKRVDVCYFMNCRTLEEYNDDVLASYAYEEVDAEQRTLNDEEFDLLKEVLL